MGISYYYCYYYYVTFIQGVYNFGLYLKEPMFLGYVLLQLSLQFMVPLINVLCFYLSIFRSMCPVRSIAVFLSSHLRTFFVYVF
jgi:cadmium resistance protein CadD (predicted permease)